MYLIRNPDGTQVLFKGRTERDGDRIWLLAVIFHGGVEQRSGERVRRLVNIEPNETATHRFFEYRL
jgi:hypothetical protein